MSDSTQPTITAPASVAVASEPVAAASPPAPTSEQGTAAATPATAPTGSKQDTTTSATSKDNAAASKPSVLEQVKRYIPGLGSKDEPSKTSKRKKSGKKTGTSSSTDVAHAKDPALATATLETAPSREDLPKELQASGRPRIVGLNGTPVEDEADTKKFSAAAYVQKRFRANNKKIQKLQSYEAQTSPLNEDQKKSLQQKPVLEAIQRELAEISKAFEAEEADEAKRAEKQKKAEESRVQQRVAAAVSDQKVQNQNDLALLLQFLHLYSLFNPGQSTQYAQTTVPPVVANATAQQHRAVHELFHSLANGPLVGTGDDAVSHIENLRSGSSKPVIEGVTFYEVKQMILDLTAGPSEMGHELPASDEPVSSSAAKTAVPPADDSSAAPAASGLNFMQASEIESGNAQQNAVSAEVGSNAATPGFGNTPSVEKTEAAANGSKNGWEAAPSTHLSPETLPRTQVSGWEEAPNPVKSWADEVDESSPANPFTTTPDVPADTQEQKLTAAPTVDADGFIQETRGRGRNDRARGRGRGQNRGRGGSGGEWVRRERSEGQDTNTGFRGGRGRGVGADNREGFRGRGGRGGRARPQSGSIPTTASTGEA